MNVHYYPFVLKGIPSSPEMKSFNAKYQYQLVNLCTKNKSEHKLNENGDQNFIIFSHNIRNKLWERKAEFCPF